MSKLYGLLGEKLGHSISPKLHSMVFEELGIKGFYHLLEVEREKLYDAIKGLLALGAVGVNVTIPYKVEALKYIDALSPEAEDIGAINTIHFSNGKMIGYNTDYIGFGMLLDKFNVNILGKNVVILGTGGASKSVLQFMLNNGARSVIIVSRNVTKVTKEVKKCKLISYGDIKHLHQHDIVVNCTPCGMYPDVDCSPIPIEDMSLFNTAVDLVYNPCETLFLRDARTCGLKAVSGLYMLVAQGVAAQEIWQGIKIRDTVADKIYNYFLENGLG